MRPPRRPAVAVAALVPLGTIGGHVAGYALAGRHPGLDGSHSHLGPAAWLTAAAAAAGIAWIAGTRVTAITRPRVAVLATAQAALFVGLEAVEQLAAGHSVESLGSLGNERALRWGVLAQVVTAAAMVLASVLARASGERVRALLSAPARTLEAPPVVVPGRDNENPQGRSLVAGSPASERGPPLHLVPA